MIQLFVKCRRSNGTEVYSGIKKEYETKKEAYLDFRNFLDKYKIKRAATWSGYRFKIRSSHVPKHFSWDMKRCDIDIQDHDNYLITYKLTNLR